MDSITADLLAKRKRLAQRITRLANLLAEASPSEAAELEVYLQQCIEEEQAILEVMAWEGVDDGTEEG